MRNNEQNYKDSDSEKMYTVELKIEFEQISEEKKTGTEIILKYIIN